MHILKAKYQSKCRTCKETIEIGEMIAWSPEEGAHHTRCLEELKRQIRDGERGPVKPSVDRKTHRKGSGMMLPPRKRRKKKKTRANERYKEHKEYKSPKSARDQQYSPLLSMEQLRFHDPLELLQRNPDYYKFIYGEGIYGPNCSSTPVDTKKPTKD